MLPLVAKTLISFEYIHHHQILDAAQNIPFPPYTMRMRQMSQLKVKPRLNDSLRKFYPRT